MHTQFRKNLAKMMVFAIAIPTVYTNANVSYGQEDIVYIDNNVDITTTTGAAIEIVLPQPAEDNNNISGPAEVVNPEDSDKPQYLLSDDPLEAWDGINMIEPQLQDSTYLITSPDEMAWIEDQVNNYSLETKGITLQLQNDIDFNGYYVTIGNKNSTYRGNFDGNNHTIRGVDFTQAGFTNGACIGLFGYTEGGIYNNINLDVYFSYEIANHPANGLGYYGALIGYAKNIEQIDNITVANLMKIDRLNISSSGGVIGYLETNTGINIDNIHSNVSYQGGIKNSGSKPGGVIGTIQITSQSADISFRNSSVVIKADSYTELNGGICGVIGNMNNYSMTSGTFTVENSSVDLLLANYYTNESTVGITKQLNGFNEINVNNYDFNVEMVSVNSSYGDKAALFGSVMINGPGNLNVENSRMTGKTEGSITIEAFISNFSGYNTDINFRNCEKTIDTTLTYLSNIAFGSLISYCTASNNVTVNDCVNESFIYAGSGGAGGLFGKLYCTSLEVNNCTNKGDISSGLHSGGLVGDLTCSTTLKINNFKNYGSFPADSYGTYVGGFIGWMAGSCKEITITDSANYGDINHASSWAGGFIGMCNTNGSSTNLVIKNCISAGNLSDTGTTGGFIGQISSNVSIEDSSFTGKISSRGEFGGIIGNCYAYSGKVFIKNCEIDMGSALLSGKNGGGLVSSLYANEVIIEGNNIRNINTEVEDNNFGGLIYISNSDNITISGNTIDNIRIKTDSVYQNYRVGGLISSTSDRNLNIENNTITNMNIITDDTDDSFLIGKVNAYSGYNTKLAIKNNLVQGTFNADLDNADLVGILNCPLELGGNIIIIEGSHGKSGVHTIKDDGSVIQSAPNYYVEDITEGVVSSESDLMIPIKKEDLKNMATFKGLDFDTVWGYTEDNLEHPVLNIQTYSIELGALTGMGLGDSQDIIAKVSHPAFKNSLVYEIDNPNIAKIEDGKLIALKEGEVTLTVRTEDLPLSNQLEVQQTITIKDYSANLKLKDISMYQGQSIQNLKEFVDTFELSHPYDDLSKDIREDATYELVSIKDINGEQVDDVVMKNLGEYEITIRANYNSYTATETGKFIVEEFIENVSYDNSVIEVNFGTQISKVTLPNKATIHYKDQTTSEIKGITWDSSSYDSSQEGEYTVTVNIQLLNGLTLNGENEVVITKVIKVLPKKVKPVRPEEEIDNKEWFVPETKPTETVTEEKEERVTVSFKVGRDRWYINGELMHKVMDQSPELKNDRAYVPLRFLSYALQVHEDDIKWDNTSKAVEIVDRGNKIELTIGSNIAILNGQPFEMDGAPYLSNGRVMLPISQIQGVFKNRQPIVSWNQEYKRVDITITLSNYKGQLI